MDNVGIGNFVLGQTLGQGEFGKCKLARHTVTGELVAIKIIDKNRLPSEYARRNLWREIKVLSMLGRHPHVVQLYEVMEAGDLVFIVLEYAEGGEVFDYIVAKGRLSERDGVRNFVELVSALQHMHARGVVHRDLKAENLLLDTNRSIKVSDFGLSNTFSPGEILKTHCGSPAYAAPELLLGEDYEGPLTDVWSIGVVLFVLVCGYLPFEGNSDVDIYRNVVNVRLNIPHHVSPKCAHLIRSLLRRNPKERLPLSETLKHPWVLEGVAAGLVKIPEVVNIPDSEASFPVDSEVASFMEQQYGIPHSDTHEAVSGGKFNPTATTYHLLCRRKSAHARLHGTPQAQRPAHAASGRLAQTQKEQAAPKTAPIPRRAPQTAASPPPGSPAPAPASHAASIAAATAAAAASHVPPHNKQHRTGSIPGYSAAPRSPATSVGSASPAYSASSSPPVQSRQRQRRTTVSCASPQSSIFSPGPSAGSSPQSSLPPPAIGGGYSSSGSNTPKPLVDSLPKLPTQASAAPPRASSSPPMGGSGISGMGRDRSMSLQPRHAPGGRDSPGPQGNASSLSLGSGAAQGNMAPPTTSMKVVRFPISVARTSTKPPHEIVPILTRELDNLGITWRANEFVVTCMAPKKVGGSGDPVRFKLEVVQIPRLSLHGVRSRRVSGSAWTYKKLLSKLFNATEL